MNSGARGEGPYVSEHHAALFEDLGLVVVVDVELGEEDFVLVSRVCSLERFLCLGCVYASELNEGPKSGVVEVVDVAYL